MRDKLVAATAGLFVGWMLFDAKGQKVAKDICMVALDASGIGDDRIGRALKNAMCDPEQPALEEHHAHNPSDDHHPDSHETMHTPLADLEAKDPAHGETIGEAQHAIP